MKIKKEFENWFKSQYPNEEIIEFNYSYCQYIPRVAWESWQQAIKETYMEAWKSGYLEAMDDNRIDKEKFVDYTIALLEQYKADTIEILKNYE
jgi:hypothetical protein